MVILYYYTLTNTKIASIAVISVIMTLSSVTGIAIYQDVFAAKGGTEKVEVCHNGITISVPRNAVDKHLEHGDSFGACEVGPTASECSCSNGGAIGTVCSENMDDCNEFRQQCRESCGINGGHVTSFSCNESCVLP